MKNLAPQQMNIQKVNLHFRTTLWITCAVVIILLSSLITLLLTAGIISSDRFYKGVSIYNVDVSGMTRDEAFNRLNKLYQEPLDGQKIVLKCTDIEVELNFPELDASYNINQAIDEAYSIGRSGNGFKRILDIWNVNHSGRNIAMCISYNHEKVSGVVDSIYAKVYTPVVEPTWKAEGDRAVISSGTHGVEFDKTAVLSQIDSMVSKAQGGILNIPLIVRGPSKITLEEVLKDLEIAPMDASCKVEGNQLLFIPHTIGRSIDPLAAAPVIDELNEKEGIVRTIPFIHIKPEMELERLESTVFRDVLSSFSTYYDSDTSNRGINIRLAAEKINNIIIGPGEVFSFNEATGECSAEEGFLSAPTYVGGTVVDGIGGGICQVSSTLLNNVLYADLELVERTFHQFIVSYIPVGHDAAVDSVYVDLKFRNNTNWPVKILATAQDGVLTTQIVGTDEHPNRWVEIRNEILEVYYPGETVYIEDPDLYEGEVLQTIYPMNGFLVDTYKIVWENGTMISNEFLYRSYYAPLAGEVHVGIRQVE